MAVIGNLWKWSFTSPLSIFILVMVLLLIESANGQSVACPTGLPSQINDCAAPIFGPWTYNTYAPDVQYFSDLNSSISYTLNNATLREQNACSGVPNGTITYDCHTVSGGGTCIAWNNIPTGYLAEYGVTLTGPLKPPSGVVACSQTWDAVVQIDAEMTYIHCPAGYSLYGEDYFVKGGDGSEFPASTPLDLAQPFACARSGPPQSALDITATQPLIYNDSRVQDKHVLTSSTLTLMLSNSNGSVGGKELVVQSNRGMYDSITQPIAPTDAVTGFTTAEVETRTQTGVSVITSSTPSVTTRTAANIAWLPAKYESKFKVTCYALSQESDYLKTPLIKVNGLKKKYHKGFLDDVRMQGSGAATDGKIIHYNARDKRYNPATCPKTATGACAVDGSTIAVDKSVIPYKSTVSIDGDGQRIAQDTGGWINEYHIDEYYGTRRGACLAAGTRYLNVTFDNY